MKNWKTTLAGFAVGFYPLITALIDAYNAGYFTNKTGTSLAMGIGFILIGALAKDHNVTGGQKQV